MKSPLDAALTSAKVLICVGPGGVGKTTVAAALALGSALRQAPSLVCTIDPARRLANALGLASLGNTETRISSVELQKASLPNNAPLYATMLDMKQSWDELMQRLLSTKACEAIFANRFYQSLSTSLAGSLEYIAMERVARFQDSKAYSLIVLDTPPAAHALDFIRAPRKVLDVFDNDAAKWLLTPALTAGKLGLSLLNFGGNFITKALAKFTGAATLKELAEFMLSLKGATAGLEERAHKVEALLKKQSTQFVLVTGPNADRLDELILFQNLLRERQLGVAAVVVNRVHVSPDESQRQAASEVSASLRPKVELALEEASLLAKRDELGMTQLRRLFPADPLVLLPRLNKDVHDLAGLYRMSRYLMGDEKLNP